MEIIWWEPNATTKIYMKSHNESTDSLQTTRDVQNAEEISSSNLQTVKNWLVNNMGIDQSKIHSGPKPPR